MSIHSTRIDGHESVHNEELETDNEGIEKDYEESDGDDDYNEIEDDSLTDFEPVNEEEIGQNQYKDCGACSKILTTENSFKCKTCGIASHRSNCNTWFDHVKKHYFCGGCMYDFELKE